MSVVINSHSARDSSEIFDELLKHGKNLLEDLKKTGIFKIQSKPTRIS